MAFTRLKTWTSELLTSSDLNDEFNNLITNDALLGFPRTADAAFASFKATFDADADTYIQSSTDDELIVAIGGTLFTFKLSSGGLTVEGASGEPVAVWQPSINVSDNLIINGGFQVSQRGTTFNSGTTPANSDNNYLFDRWRLISDGNNIVGLDKEVAASAVTASGASAVCKLTVVSAAQFGLFQPIEAADARKCRGGKLSLSFDARKITGAPATNIRAAILSWGAGTADDATVANDPVSAWNGAGSNPTWTGTPWLALNTPADIALTDTHVRQKIENVTVASTACNNLAVAIWCDTDSLSLGDGIYIGNVQLELGEHSTPFRARRYSEELSECQRFYERIGGNTALTPLGVGVFTTSDVAVISDVQYETKRDTPVGTVVGHATLALTMTGHGGASGTSSTVTVVNESLDSARLTITSVAGMGGAAAAGTGCLVSLTAASDYIDIDAEL